MPDKIKEEWQSADDFNGKRRRRKVIRYAPESTSKWEIESSSSSTSVIADEETKKPEAAKSSLRNLRHKKKREAIREAKAAEATSPIYVNSGDLFSFVRATEAKKSDNMEAALAASRAGQHHVLTDFVARNEGKELRFHDKSLGDSGAYAVAKGLQVNKTLQLLDISWNKIGAQGAEHIAEHSRSITC
eukprot:g23920.t1